MRMLAWVLSLSLFCLSSFAVAADEMRLAVTTSFHNSGLSNVLLPAIKKDTGIDVHLLVVGTGQALKLGRQGDVDAVLVHSKKAEEQFIEEGFGTRRTEIMYNDFVFIGPKDDPAKLTGSKDAHKALKNIATTKSPFVSRGDESGTHKREISLWKAAGYDTKAHDSSWYREVGAGMGAALNIASGMNAYILADRASWLNFKNKGGLALLNWGDPKLFNQYALLTLNAEKHPHIKSGLAKKLEAWLVSEKAQKLIGTYQIDGQALFVPNAKKVDAS